MAERNRPGDDAAGVPGDDEGLANTAAGDEAPDDAEPVSRGGAAVAERTKDAEKPSKPRKGGVFGRIGGFFREVVSELRKVNWPSRRELLTYTSVVIVFLVVVTTVVTLLDYGFGKAILWALGS